MPNESTVISKLKQETGIQIIGRVSIYNELIRYICRDFKVLLVSLVLCIPSVVWQITVDLYNVPLILRILLVCATASYILSVIDIGRCLIQYIAALVAHHTKRPYRYYKVVIEKGTPLSIYKTYSHLIVWCSPPYMILRIKLKEK